MKKLKSWAKEQRKEEKKKEKKKNFVNEVTKL